MHSISHFSNRNIKSVTTIIIVIVTYVHIQARQEDITFNAGPNLIKRLGAYLGT